MQCAFQTIKHTRCKVADASQPTKLYKIKAVVSRSDSGFCQLVKLKSNQDSALLHGTLSDSVKHLSRGTPALRRNG